MATYVANCNNKEQSELSLHVSFGKKQSSIIHKQNYHPRIGQRIYEA